MLKVIDNEYFISFNFSLFLYFFVIFVENKYVDVLLRSPSVSYCVRFGADSR